MKRKKIAFDKSPFRYTVIKKKKICIKSEPEFYLPEDCWEHIFTFLINGGNGKTENKHNLYVKSLSLVSKLFLSITNRLVFSMKIYDTQPCFLPDIALALRDRPALKSLSISWIKLKDAKYITSQYVDSFVSLKGLNSLKFRYSQISDYFLYSIAREGISLKRFVLEHCTDYSYDGIYGLLSKCHGIQHLGLERDDLLNNHQVVELSLLLPNLESINLSYCSKLTKLALFAFIRNCHSLDEITMKNIYTWKDNVENSDSFKDFRVNPQLKFLYLAHNLSINDESIILFASIFPNLQLLDLSYCNFISENGISQVLRKCTKIRHLNLQDCFKVTRLKMNFVVLELEVLNLSDTSVDDKTLFEISKSCPQLVHLSLRCCKHVTEKGVIRVGKKCTQLKEIDLKFCDKVNGDVVSKLLSRPTFNVLC